MERDEGRDAIDEVPLEFFEVLAPFGEDYRRPAMPDQLQRLAGNQLRPLVVIGEGTEDLLGRGFGGKRGGIEAGLATNDAQLQRPLPSRRLVDRVADRPALH